MYTAAHQYFIGYATVKMNLCQMTYYMMILNTIVTFMATLLYTIGYITAPMSLYPNASNLMVGNDMVVEHMLRQ